MRPVSGRNPRITKPAPHPEPATLPGNRRPTLRTDYPPLRLNPRRRHLDYRRNDCQLFGAAPHGRGSFHRNLEPTRRVGRWHVRTGYWPVLFRRIHVLPGDQRVQGSHGSPGAPVAALGLPDHGLSGGEPAPTDNGRTDYSPGRVFIYTQDEHRPETGSDRLDLPMGLARAGGVNEQSQNTGVLRNAARRLQLPARP